MNAKTISLLGRDGKKIEGVMMRKALPTTAERVRYPGFKQESTILKAGTYRRPGAKPLECDILLERDVPVRLHDGVVIYVDVFRPVDGKPVPAIMAWSPYGKEVGGQMLDDVPERSGVPLNATTGLEKFEGPDPSYWVSRGYAIVNPDKRGAYKSEGDILYWGHQDAMDGCDVIEWIAEQPWCTGKVGMEGNSWLAVSQWFIAAEKPEHLAAIAPWEGFSDHYRESGTRGGIPMPEFPLMIANTFSSDNGLLEDQPRMIVERPLIDNYWEDKAPLLENITIPAYVVASYTNPVHTHGTFAGFRRISSPEKWLRVHNTGEWFDQYNDEHMDDLRRFFDHYLKNEDNGWENTPRVRLSVLNPGGEDIINRVENEWPLNRTEYRKLHLNASDSSLTYKEPSDDGVIVYNSDEAGCKAVFRLIMPEKTEITGYMKLHLFASALDNDDMDLAVSVEKLSKDGKQLLGFGGTPPVATGYLRASLRKTDTTRSTEAEPYYPFNTVEKLTPGEIIEMDIEIWPMGLIFEKGEILQLTVGPYRASDATIPFGKARITIPKDSYTFNSGEDMEMMTIGGNDTEVSDTTDLTAMNPLHNKGRHAIYTGIPHDSYLYIPVIPNEN